jgi:predicted  nucleic acid-binding Zn-ribbon protein
MKKMVSFLLIASFIISVSGCTAKSEYEKLLDEKASIQKRCDGLRLEKEDLKEAIGAREMEIKDLKTALKKAEARAKSFEKGLADSKAE